MQYITLWLHLKLFSEFKMYNFRLTGNFPLRIAFSFPRNGQGTSRTHVSYVPAFRQGVEKFVSSLKTHAKQIGWSPTSCKSAPKNEHHSARFWGRKKKSIIDSGLLGLKSPIRIARIAIFDFRSPVLQSELLGLLGLQKLTFKVN